MVIFNSFVELPEGKWHIDYGRSMSSEYHIHWLWEGWFMHGLQAFESQLSGENVACKKIPALIAGFTGQIIDFPTDFWHLVDFKMFNCHAWLPEGIGL